MRKKTNGFGYRIARPAGGFSLLLVLLGMRPACVEAASAFPRSPTSLPLWGRLLPLVLGLLILIACVVHELRKKKR